MRLCEPQTTTSERSYPMLPFCPLCIEAVAQPLRCAVSIVDPRSTVVKRFGSGGFYRRPRAHRVELAQRRRQLGHPGLVLAEVAKHALHSQQRPRIPLTLVGESAQLVGPTVLDRDRLTLLVDAAQIATKAGDDHRQQAMRSALGEC